MDLDNFLIKRFLKGGNKSFPLLSLFGVIGVLLGVFAIIVVISVMSGFENGMVQRLIGTQPHIYITDKDNPSHLSSWAEVYEILEREMKGSFSLVSPYVESETVVYYNNVTIGAVIFAVSDDLYNALKMPLVSGRDLVLGQQFGVIHKLIEGDKLKLLSAWDLVTSTTTAPKLRTFNVKSYVRTGTYSRDLKYIYMNINEAMKYFTPLKGIPTGLVLLLDDPMHAENVEIKIKEKLNNFTNLDIETWQERNKRIFWSLRLERFAMILTLFFIVLVASFSIVVSLVLMVEARKGEFTILMSMGYTKARLRKVLLLIALIKGSLGAVTGGILGTFLCYLLDKYRFIGLPSIYYDTYLPVDYNPWFSLLVVFVSILICMLGAVYPFRLLTKLTIAQQLTRK